MSIFNKLFDDNNKSSQIIGLTDELKCLYAYNLFNKTNKGVLLVTSSLYEASNYYQSLLNYTDDVLFFPMDDFLTSEALAISPEFKITRLETLKMLAESNNKIVIANLMGYLRYLPTKNKFKASKITLKVNDTYKIDDLISELYNYGYTKEVVVNKTGEIAVRGFVVDIFPISDTNPIRIEYWGDQIDSIRIFDINSQLTIKSINEVEINANTEFLVDKDIDTFDLKQRDLPKYTTVTNISDYVGNITIFDDYRQLEVSYKLLLDEMLNYNISLNIDGNTSYMNDFYNIKNNEEVYFVNFDDVINASNSITYNGYDLEPFSGNTLNINSRLNEYIKLKKDVIICLNDQYKVNKIINE